MSEKILFVSLTTHTCLIFDDFSCFLPIIWQKYTRHICLLQKNSPILDFCSIEELVNVKMLICNLLYVLQRHDFFSFRAYDRNQTGSKPNFFENLSIKVEIEYGDKLPQG